MKQCLQVSEQSTAPLKVMNAVLVEMQSAIVVGRASMVRIRRQPETHLSSSLFTHATSSPTRKVPGTHTALRHTRPIDIHLPHDLIRAVPGDHLMQRTIGSTIESVGAGQMLGSWRRSRRGGGMPCSSLPVESRRVRPEGIKPCGWWSPLGSFRGKRLFPVPLPLGLLLGVPAEPWLRSAWLGRGGPSRRCCHQPQAPPSSPRRQSPRSTPANISSQKCLVLVPLLLLLLLLLTPRHSLQSSSYITTSSRQHEAPLTAPSMRLLAP
jgi:hypothetical protein